MPPETPTEGDRALPVRGDVLRSARQRKGWEQEELRRKTEVIRNGRKLYISLNTIRKAEGGGPCFLGTIRRLADALEIDPGQLIGQADTHGSGLAVTVEKDPESNAVDITAYIHLRIKIGEDVSDQSPKLLAIREILRLLAPDGGVKLLSLGAGIAVFGVAKTRANEVALVTGTLRESLKGSGAILSSWHTVDVPASPSGKSFRAVRPGRDRIEPIKKRLEELFPHGIVYMTNCLENGVILFDKAGTIVEEIY